MLHDLAVLISGIIGGAIFAAAIIVRWPRLFFLKPLDE